MVDFTRDGRPTGEVPVQVGAQIIKLFSGNLYQSPTKAVEELVANSYDALAGTCHVIIPATKSSRSRIIVWDDGHAMNVEGLHNLWRIASSTKREVQSAGRLPVGKFGIGKLASYVLARKLTHVTKKDGVIRAVTMDFAQFDTKEDVVSTRLSVRELTDDQADELLEMPEIQEAGVNLDLRSSDSWTFAILSDLKEVALQFPVGRLRWVLRTALPHAPDFSLFLNGEKVEPSKSDVEPLLSWTLGKEDEVARKLEFDTREVPRSAHRFEVEVPELGPIWGVSEVYENTLTTGKSAEWGRSHGIFVMVRGRLVNSEDALFGLKPLSHATFNRWRLVVHADGLDDAIVASREAVHDTRGVVRLREYLDAKFKEARAAYTDLLREEDYEKRLKVKLGTLHSGLIGRPVLHAIEDALDGKEEDRPRLFRLPAQGDEAGRTALREGLKKARAEPFSFVDEVVTESLGPDIDIAILDPVRRKILVNADHPFYIDYVDGKQPPGELYKVFAVSEVLTELWMRDHAIPPATAESVVELRDEFLRQIVRARPVSAIQIARRLRDSVGNEKALEEAVADAWKSLGFEVTPMGGSGKPDGKARAILGYSHKKRSDGSYSLTYDAKSTSGEKTSAKDLNAAAVVEHRKAWEADYAVIVAKNFATTNEGEELSKRIAHTQKITLLRAGDLANLVEAKATKFLSLHRLRDLFETCRTPEEAAAWVEVVVSEPTQPAPVKELLEVVYALQARDPDEVTVAGVKDFDGRLSAYRQEDIATWLQGLNALVPQLVYFNHKTRRVELHARPDKVLAAIAEVVNQLPASLKKGAEEAYDG